ncbi:MAG: hypothetical protein ACNA7I_02225 [Candidatus Methanoperedens sp.]
MPSAYVDSSSRRKVLEFAPLEGADTYAFGIRGFQLKIQKLKHIRR